MSQSIFEPDPEPVRKKTDPGRIILFVLLGVGGFLLVFCAGSGLLIFWGVRQDMEQVRKAAEARAAQPMASLPPVKIESAAQRQADFRAAFDSPDPGVDEKVLASLRTHFDEVIEAMKTDDAPRFRRNFMARRFMVEVERTGLVQDLTVADEQAYIDDFQNRWIELPGDWTRYRIVHVKPNVFDFVVTVCFWDEDNDVSELRYWITAAVAELKCFDWEEIGFGVRESLEAAVHIKHKDDPRFTDYLQIERDLDQLGELLDQGRQADARALLKQTETRWRPPELLDMRQTTLAFYWQTLGNERESLRCARGVREPDRTPRAFQAQGLAFQGLGADRQALEMIKRYEAATGSGPRTCELRAGLHERLGEMAQAAESWQKLLRFDPENIEALASLANLLDESNVHTIVERLRVTSHPARNATQIAGRLVSAGNIKVLRALAEFVTELDGDSAGAAFVQGLCAQADGEPAVAAAHFKTAFERETDPQTHENYVTRFLDAMLAADQAVEGYERAPDPEAAFEHLLAGDDEDESTLKLADRRALIEAHRRRQPDDPRIPFYAGLLLRDENDLEGATRELAAALQQADDDDREEVRWVLVSAMHDAGRDVQAYQSIAPADGTFRELVQFYRWGDGTDDADRLKELHRLHEAAHPDDRWLDYCAALVCRCEKNIGEALHLARQGYDRADDEGLKNQFQRLVVELATPNADFSTAYPMFGNRDTALTQLGQRIASTSDWDQLDSLLTWHLENGGDRSPAWWSRKIQLSWNKRDFEGVVLGFEELQKSPGNELSEWELRRFSEWYVRSLLKLDRRDQALHKAQELYDETAQVRPLIFARAIANEAVQIERLLAENNLQTYDLDGLYDDPDVGPVFASSAFQPVRRKFPPSLSDWTDFSTAILLLASPMSLTTDTLKVAADSIEGGEAVVEDLDQPSQCRQPGVTGQWLIRNGESRLIVTSGTGHYELSQSSGRAWAGAANDRLKAALADHAGWTSIDQINGTGDRADGRPAGVEGFRLVRRVAPDDCLAVFVAPAARLIEPSAELTAALEAEEPSTALAKLGTPHWMSRPSPETTPGQENQSQRYERTLNRLAAALQSRGAGQVFEIVVAVHWGSAAELLRVDLESVKRGPYRQMHFTGTLRESSRFCSRLSAGEPVAVPAYQVVEWTLTDGQQRETFRRRE
jgi:tetratricopeptide (TPR) repeat protein